MSLAAESVSWLMILVNPFPNCAFWSGAGVISALQGALRKTFTHFVSINAFFHVLGGHAKIRPPLELRDLT